MAPNDSDKSNAAQTLDSLNVGDVIRLPKFYSNALAVVSTTAIGIRVEFVDDALAARGTTKDLIRSKFTGEYGLVAGTADKGTVWTVEVVARGEDEDSDDMDDDADAAPFVDGGALSDLARDSDRGAYSVETPGEDVVEFVLQFEKPVTAEVLRATFQDLADAAAGEADDADVDEGVETDGESPVADAAAFEDALQSFVTRTIRDGVHPSDVSTVLFAEANRIAGAMWSPDRDDAEILP